MKNQRVEQVGLVKLFGLPVHSHCGPTSRTADAIRQRGPVPRCDNVTRETEFPIYRNFFNSFHACRGDLRPPESAYDYSRLPDRSIDRYFRVIKPIGVFFGRIPSPMAHKRGWGLLGRGRERLLPMSRGRREVQSVGWREMVGLPDLCDTRIPAKIDTGARTSSLHATVIERFDRDEKRWVRFLLDIGDGKTAPVTCEVPRADKRIITSSNGESQERLIIKTTLQLGAHRFRAEFSLADRSDMKFPILIGRTALRSRFVVDSGRSYLHSDEEERRRLLG